MSGPRVRCEHDGAVVPITSDRLERRVNRPTSTALVEASERFDADREVPATVLAGDAGTFCAGANLKALPEGGGNRMTVGGLGP